MIMALQCKQGLNVMTEITYKYSKSCGFTKCFAMIWGKDKSIYIPILFGNSELEVVDKSRHL